MRHEIQVCPLHGFHLFQDLVQHIQIQPGDQLGTFQNGDKICRRKEPFHRIDPAGQGFFVADPSVGSPDDGLIVYFDPFLLQGPVQVAGDILAGIGLLQHGFIKVIVSGSVLVPVLVAGIFCPVAGRRRLHRFHPVQVDAYPHGQAVPVVQFPAFGNQLLQPFFQIFLVGEGGEMILGKTAALFAAKIVYQNVSKTGEELIPFGKSELAVIILHAVQVQEQENRVLSLLQQAQLCSSCQFKEIAHTGQSRETVILVKGRGIGEAFHAVCAYPASLVLFHAVAPFLRKTRL